MAKTVEQLLEYARGDAISILGIGGYIPAHDFNLAYEEIDAITFAKIIYATDQMMVDFDGDEALNPANIKPTIAKYNFKEREHFAQVTGIFKKYFGAEVVALTTISMSKQIRDSIIEHLNLVASFKDQLSYEQEVPIADVPAEVLDGWIGSAHSNFMATLDTRVFSIEELNAMEKFDATLEDVAKRLFNHSLSLRELFLNQHWQRLRDEALVALKSFK